MCDICHTYWSDREKFTQFRLFNRRAIAGFPSVARKKIEQPALIYVAQLLATATNDAKKLGELRGKSYPKGSVGELYEITG